MDKFYTWLEDHPDEKEDWLDKWNEQNEEDMKLKVCNL